MKKILFLLFLSPLLVLEGADSDNQTVTFTVQTINEFALSGNPGPLTIDSATAGSDPTDATDSSTTYSITTNDTNKTITGSVDSAMPSGMTLSVELAAPTGATSLGAVSLTTTPQNLVTGIANLAESNLGITYTLSATAAATPEGPSNRTVTLTIGP